MGFFVSLALWLLPLQEKVVTDKAWIGKFRRAADLTFPIYVLHQPLLVLFRSLVATKPSDAVQCGLALLSALLLCAATGLLLEKQRRYWVTAFGWILRAAKKNLQPVQRRTQTFLRPGAVSFTGFSKRSRTLTSFNEHTPS